MAKFDYKKWVIKNKHGLRLNEQNTPSNLSVPCGVNYSGACHMWKECINGNPSGNDIVFIDIFGNLDPTQMWTILGTPNQGDAILTNTGVKLIYSGLGGDSLDMSQFQFPGSFGGQQSGFGQPVSSATPTQCDFGWRCHWKTTPQDMGESVLNEWAPYHICVPGTATNPGSFVTKRQCLDSGCLEKADDYDDIAYTTDVNPFNDTGNNSSVRRPRNPVDLPFDNMEG